MIIGWIIAAAVAVVVGAAALMKKMQQKMMDKQAGIMVGKTGGSNPIKMIYGKRRVGTDNIWKGLSGYKMPQASGWDSAYVSPKEGALGNSYKKVFLHRLDVWCQGPVHSIGNYKIDDDKTSHSRFANGSRAWARILTKLGNPSQTMFSALISGHNDITADMTGQGLAYSWSRFYYKADDPEFQGEPNVTAEVQGLKVWDPRTNPNNPTVKSWSDNPALCLLDYLLASYGRELSIADLDIPSFIAAANSCDTPVALPAAPVAAVPATVYANISGQMVAIPAGGFYPDYRIGQPSVTRKRYTTNLVLESDNTTIDNCSEILKTMKGSLPFVNGQYRLLMEEEGVSVMVFNDSNIIGGVNLGWADRSKRLNRATVKFPNENKGYQPDTVSWPASASALHTAYKSADNGEDLHTEFEMTGVTDFYQARDMCEFAVRESRSQEYVTFKAQPPAMALECGDVITVTNDVLDIVSKKYRVRETSMNADLTVTVKAQIYDETIYPWSVGDEAAEAVTLNITPSLFDQPAAMQGVAATTATRLNEDGTAHTDVTVVWSDIVTGTSDIDVVEVGYKLNTEGSYTWAVLPADVLTHTLVGLQDGQLYNIAARYRNVIGKFSAVVVVNIGTLTAGTNLGAAAVAAKAAADAAAVLAAQALTDAAAASAAVVALDFSPYLQAADLPDISGFISQAQANAAAAEAVSNLDLSSFLQAEDLPDISAFISQAEIDAAQAAAEAYADTLTENLQTADQVAAALLADTTVIDGSRITTGTIVAARVSIAGKNISALKNNSGYATTTQVSEAVAAIDLSDYVASGDLAGYISTSAGAALQLAAETYADTLTENLQTAAQVTAAITADTTVINGSRITTGTIAAARISIAGKNASDLNNDAFAVPGDIPDVSGLATTVEVTDAQLAAQSYADGLTTGLQTAAQVTAAIVADTTVIDGARITTGIINASRISLSGKNISDLNNNSGYALTSQIPSVSGLQTAAQVAAAIQSDTTTIDGARIVTGQLSADRVSGGTLDFNNVIADNLFVSSLRGDVNTLIPFQKTTTQTIPSLSASTSYTAFEGTIPASGSDDVQRKPYFSATGWGVFENDDVYKLELYMRVNDPSPSSSNSGMVLDPLFNPANIYIPASCSLKLAGNVFLAAGTVLQDSTSPSGTSPRTLGAVWFAIYDAPTNRTTISYFGIDGAAPIVSQFGRYAITPPAVSGYTLVNEFFFRSPFDYDPYQFAINGALNERTQYSVDCQVRVRLFNQVGSGAIPNTQPTQNWLNDRIYNISGIMMALR